MIKAFLVEFQEKFRKNEIIGELKFLKEEGMNPRTLEDSTSKLIIEGSTPDVSFERTITINERSSNGNGEKASFNRILEEA